MNKKITAKEYLTLFNDVKKIIRTAQYTALKKVNKELIGLYWDIGRMIVSRRQGKTWGKSIVEKLSNDLKTELPGLKGFSPSSLWRMKLFYEAYTDNKKLAPLVREISWSHNIVIMEKCKDIIEREFYICIARKFGWSKNVLIHQIENQTYEKTLLNQTNFEKTLPDMMQRQARLVVKDEYTFDFLELGEEHSENDLEQALLSRVEHFLRAMGGALAFVGSQFCLEISNREYYIDILLYHRRLKSLIAVELKIGEFKPEYVGKMQFYLSALDEKIKMQEENPSIGIIVCKSKDKTIVEYTLKESNKPIGVATYRIVQKLPKNLKKELPSPEQVKKWLED